MIEKMKKNGSLWINLLMLFSCLFSVGLLFYRVHTTRSLVYVFLLWNLILACIPYGITTLIILNKNIKNSRWLFWSLFACWFVFIPNAPYIITDLFHLRVTRNFPIWYDLLLIISFAWNGLLLCFLSIADMQKVIEKKLNPLFGWVMALGLLFLSGFGIYLGRFLRWNSWDLINNTGDLVEDVSRRIIYPAMHLRTWGVTIGFGVFLILGYLFFKELSKQKYPKQYNS